jgi:RNA 3'-terminal phosphate cyclase-like protein
MVAAATRAPAFRFKGAAYLRQRLVLATLAGRTVRFDDIRVDDDSAPGLSPAEISFVRLLDKITNGSAIEISETGTTLRYRPGLLIGQVSTRISHECHPSRPVTYYLEPLLMLAPFCKKPLDINLRGPTHGPTDPNADTLAAVSIPLLRRLTLGTPVDPEMTVVRRAAASAADVYAGGRSGSVLFKCGVLTTKIAPIDLMDAGVVKRVRGIAFANRVSPAYITQMVDGVRSALNQFTPDVYLHTDHSNSPEGGAGFGVHLVAETTEGCLLGADWAAVNKNQTPMAVSKHAVSMLLEQIAHGGCIDAQNSCMALLMCALADSDVSRVRLGRLTDATVAFLRDLKVFMGVVFKIKVEKSLSQMSKNHEDMVEEGDDGDENDIDDGAESDEDGVFDLIGGGIVMSCVGIGLTNVARQRF